jgi:hypothetical protein
MEVRSIDGPKSLILSLVVASDVFQLAAAAATLELVWIVGATATTIVLVVLALVVRTGTTSEADL